MGGDEPGCLATGDLPPAGAKIGPWVATADRAAEGRNSKDRSAKSVNWATVPAKSKSSRVYLIPESGKNFFGLNEIVLTTKDAKAARKLVDKIKSNLSRCKNRKAHRERRPNQRR